MSPFDYTINCFAINASTSGHSFFYQFEVDLLNLKSQKNKPQLAKKAHWGKIGKLLAFQDS